ITWDDADDDVLDVIGMDPRFETSWAKLEKDVVMSNLTHLRIDKIDAYVQSDKGKALVKA
ncbi:hypothetical protein Tco_1170562, partial [Tanacetum coccineum]